MATNVIMPALEMAQDKGKLLRWLKPEGATVTQGEPIMEIETDKVTVEIEAPASGILANVTAREGDVVPVGQAIAVILAANEDPKSFRNSSGLNATPVARKMAEEHGIDLTAIKPSGGKVEKADVLAHIEKHKDLAGFTQLTDFKLASPKARRLAEERGIDLATLRGSGPDGAVIAVDIPAEQPSHPIAQSPTLTTDHSPLSTVWRVMAERMTQSWTSVPHFYLVRQVDVSKFVEMRTRIAPAIESKTGIKPTYTDLLTKIVAAVLRKHPRVNASWADGSIKMNDAVNIGIAMAIEDGLIVPVVHHADKLSIGEIAKLRKDLVERANASKLKPADIMGGTFTITNLGMFNVDAFSAIINTPQAAILAVGRIADHVVAVNGQPAVRPMMTLTLSNDHRVVDGARAAKFLDELANLMEEPLGLLA